MMKIREPALLSGVVLLRIVDLYMLLKTRVAALRRGYPLFALVGTAFVMYG